jgi:hypothetical protein
MAKGSGRRSQADLNAAKLVIQLEPTHELNEEQRKVWDRVIGSWPESHWIGSDADLLTQYCAICVAFWTHEDWSERDRLGRLATSHATKLRITPQSRYNTQTAGSEARKGRSNTAAANRLIGGFGWQNQPNDATPDEVN